MNKYSALAALVFVYAAVTLSVFGTAAYAVFWLDRSGWWFLLAAMIVAFFLQFDFQITPVRDEDKGGR